MSPRNNHPAGEDASVGNEADEVHAGRQVGGVAKNFVAAGGGGDAHGGLHQPAGEVVERELGVFRVLREVVAQGHQVHRRAGIWGIEGQSGGVRSRPGGLHGTKPPDGAVR